MKILDRYIAKAILSTVLLVSLALLGFDLFFSLVNELRVIGKGEYTLGNVFVYLALSAPTRVYSLFSWSALIGTLIALGGLAAHSELVVMRASAISVSRIAGAALKAAMILLVGMLILGEGVAPFTERAAQNKRTAALSGGQSIETAYGLWVRHRSEFIHIQTVRLKGELLGITRYRFNPDRTLQETLYAKSAARIGDEWILKEIQGTRFEETRTFSFEKAEMQIPQLVEPEILETAMVKHPERLSLLSLWRTIHHRTQNELSAHNYELAFWTKIFQPLVILMMVLLGVPFVFGPLRSVSMGFKVVVGILVAFTFHTINHLFAPLAVVYQLPAFWAVVTPILVFSGIGIWLLKRVR